MMTPHRKVALRVQRRASAPRLGLVAWKAPLRSRNPEVRWGVLRSPGLLALIADKKTQELLSSVTWLPLSFSGRKAKCSQPLRLRAASNRFIVCLVLLSQVQGTLLLPGEWPLALGRVKVNCSSTNKCAQSSSSLRNPRYIIL